MASYRAVGLTILALVATALSGEPDPTNLVGGIPLNAGAAVDQLRVPTMFVVATNDNYASVVETRAMYRAVKSDAKRLRCSPATSMASMAGRCSRTQPPGRSSARPAIRSVVAEDRTTKGVRDQTGPRTANVDPNEGT
jgi:hypothetical protein